MSHVIPIYTTDLRACLMKLAQVVIFEEAHGRSGIAIRMAVAKITDDNREVADLWRSAQEDALKHHRDVVPKINALREEFTGKRIVMDKSTENTNET